MCFVALRISFFLNCIVFIYASLPYCEGILCILCNVRYELKYYYYIYYNLRVQEMYTLFKAQASLH